MQLNSRRSLFTLLLGTFLILAMNAGTETGSNDPVRKGTGPSLMDLPERDLPGMGQSGMDQTGMDQTGMHETEKAPANHYDLLDMNQLAIGMWVTPPDQFRNDREFKRIAHAGINFVNGFGYYENSPDKIKTTLDLCAKHNLKYFVNQGDIHTAILSYAEKPSPAMLDTFIAGVKEYVNHQAYAGELLFDEPGKPLFGSVAAFTKQYEKYYPDKMWHVNLFPSYATEGIRSASYEEYISFWLDQLDPGYLSFDSYPLLAGGGIIQDYFYNLDLVRTKTVERKIPFWTFIQTLSIAQTPGVPDKRDPTEEEIRWQVWVNLAFGAKGIQYFCYWSPGSGSEVFSDALITRDGKKTNKYNYVKRINSDIHKPGEVLLHCDAVGVIQTTASPYPLYRESLHSFGPIKGVRGDDNLTGCFLGPDGRHHVLVTPLTPNSGATVKFTLEDTVDYATVIKGKNKKQIKIKDGELIQSISPGDAL